MGELSIPFEMPSPSLFARMKQFNPFSGLWMSCNRLTSFVTIAKWTAPTQVIFCRFAAIRLWNDVVYLEESTNQILRTLTIRATLLKIGGNFDFKPIWNIRLGTRRI